jgi:hypothetical protein
MKATQWLLSRPFRADARTRTGDPFITSEVLYQLSYVGKGNPVERRGRERVQRCGFGLAEGAASAAAARARSSGVSELSTASLAAM